MSQGSFTIANYEADSGTIHPIKVQPETINTANPEAVGSRTGVLVRVSGGKRQIGIKARSVTLKVNVGAAVNGYQPFRTVTLPIMTPATWNALNIGQDFEYLGQTYQVAGKSPQSGRF